MNTLYDITVQYREMLEKMLDTASEDGEVDEQVMHELTQTQDALEVKAENCAAMYLEIDSEVERIKRFEGKIKTRRERLQNRRDRLKEYIDRNLTAAQIERIEGEFVNISYRKSEKVEIDNEAEIPEEYWRVTKEPDKTAIKQALKAGISMGAHLKPTKSIQIK
ncbi:MAG: siphovirus Gp157 family protein [Christensenellaceae bacterium]